MSALSSPDRNLLVLLLVYHAMRRETQTENAPSQTPSYAPTSPYQTTHAPQPRRSLSPSLQASFTSLLLNKKDSVSGGKEQEGAVLCYLVFSFSQMPNLVGFSSSIISSLPFPPFLFSLLPQVCTITRFSFQTRRSLFFFFQETTLQVHCLESTSSFYFD